MPTQQLRLIPFPSNHTPTSDPPSISIPSLIRPISPSGQFNPTDNLTSDGRPKAQDASPLHSYTDFLKMKNYLSKLNKREPAILVIGINSGLRASDIISLKVGDVIKSDENGNSCFRESISIQEKKTGKETSSNDDSILITPAMQLALSDWLYEYAEIMKKKRKTINLDDYLFYSKQPQRSLTIKKNNQTLDNLYYGQHVVTVAGTHQKFKEAQRSIGLKYNVGTHTMRNTFSALVYKISSNMNENSKASLEDVQRMLRHSSQRTTMRYMKITKERSEKIRMGISDWLLGKSDINEIKSVDGD